MNMKYTFLGLAALALAGCANLPASIQPDVTAVVNQVITACQTICGVVPDAYGVEQLIPIYGEDAVAIETAICAAVQVAEQNPSATKRFRAVLRANGKPSQVIVHGVIVHLS